MLSFALMIQQSPGLPRFDSFCKLPVARSAGRKVLSYVRVRAGCCRPEDVLKRGPEKASRLTCHMFDGARTRRSSPGIRKESELPWQAQHYTQSFKPRGRISGFAATANLMHCLRTAPQLDASQAFMSKFRAFV